MDLSDLKKPFPPERISWRVGSTTHDKKKGMALAYIDARDVQDRLDEVCLSWGWQCRYVPMHDKKTVCEIGIKIADEWIWKSDGAGDSDIEAEKGALSDSFKRAAVRWGIGRYLYDLDSPWVELDTYEKDGRTFAKGIKASEYPRLRALLAGNAQKSEPAPPLSQLPAPAPMTPKDWAKKALDIMASASQEELDVFTNKHADKIAKYRVPFPDLHKSIIDAIQVRQSQLNP